MGNPFTSISCAIRHDNARVVSWTMLQGANYPEDFRIQIENSRAGAPWEVLATDLQNTCVFVDSRRRNYNKRLNECYRLRLTIPCTNEEYLSDIVDAGNCKAYPYSPDAENVLKQVNESMKISGTPGVLLKKKLWGLRCPLCVDFDGQQTVNEHCPRCLGTGIDGGYFPGISLTVIKDSITTSESPSQVGYLQGESVKGRCIAYPWISVGDVWCEDLSNNRYVISNATPTASYKQTHLVYTLTMHKVELSDVLHSQHADDKVVTKDLWTGDTPALMPDDTAPVHRRNAWDDLLEQP